MIEGYTSELWDFTRISVTQNDFQELREIWVQWDDEVKQLFYGNYGDLPYLLDVDLVPIVEEYTALLRYPKILVDRVYFRAVNVSTFVKKLMNIIGISEQWVTARIKRKGESKCITWKNLRDLILAHTDTKKKEGHACPSNFGRNIQIFECVPKGGRGKIYWMCTILLVWFHSHFWKVDKVSYRVFFENYSPLKELVVIQGVMTLGRKDGWKSFKIFKMKMLNGKLIELGKKIKQLEEEKMHLRLDVDVQKLETEKLRKWKNKAKKDLESLKTDYKKLRLSMRTAGLGKTLEQASLSKIEEMKRRIEELDVVLQSREMRIEFLEVNEERQKEQLHLCQNQVRNIYHIMGEVVAQIREMAERLQTLAMQADVLSVKYKLESDRGQELASLLRKIKVLSIREKPYM
ncbi:hypothetical protein Gotri_006848 [Gossypium trilobum]|uniref:Uncharacterized protein n=1 Tax=Gossypium trilobum TaxID=34281 RepID=A0A7J9FKE5_9ROSI|nr:hypothetical protein [Gossypium trilobum]